MSHCKGTCAVTICPLVTDYSHSPCMQNIFTTPIKRVTPKCSLFLQILISTHLLIPFYCFHLSHQHFFSFLRVVCVPVFCIWSHLPPEEVVEISGQLIQEKNQVIVYLNYLYHLIYLEKIKQTPSSLFFSYNCFPTTSYFLPTG